ncbi:SgcJ/EcaC family oxidoreductase [Haliscomenobacter sp.]|uniref:SgcJ/EcaC family oxidoreductase n=1 Tax=Haliscomenobacter sp. TaxID=2717303 RepID=UPI00359409D1
MLTIWPKTHVSVDELEVRAVIKTMETAWNAHDYSFTGKNDIFDPNAALINPVGMYWKNKAEILKAMQSFGETRFKFTSTQYNIKGVNFLAPTVALLTMSAKDMVILDFPGGRKGDNWEGMYFITLLKGGNGWKITSLQVTDVNVNLTSMNPIK